MLFRSDRKSTRLNSSHLVISYAVFCLKKKQKKINFNNCFAFNDFTIIANPYIYQPSKIDKTYYRQVLEQDYYFNIFIPFFYMDAAPTKLYPISLQTTIRF